MSFLPGKDEGLVGLDCRAITAPAMVRAEIKPSDLMNVVPGMTFEDAVRTLKRHANEVEARMIEAGVDELYMLCEEGKREGQWS